MNQSAEFGYGLWATVNDLNDCIKSDIGQSAEFGYVS